MNLEHCRKDAKRLLRGVGAGDADALARARAVLGERVQQRFVLSDAQHVVANERGYRSWPELGAPPRASARPRAPTRAARVESIVEHGPGVPARGPGPRLGPAPRAAGVGLRPRRGAAQGRRGAGLGAGVRPGARGAGRQHHARRGCVAARRRRRARRGGRWRGGSAARRSSSSRSSWSWRAREPRRTPGGTSSVCPLQLSELETGRLGNGGP